MYLFIYLFIYLLINLFIYLEGFAHAYFCFPPCIPVVCIVLSAKWFCQPRNWALLYLSTNALLLYVYNVYLSWSLAVLGAREIPLCQIGCVGIFANEPSVSLICRRVIDTWILWFAIVNYCKYWSISYDSCCTSKNGDAVSGFSNAAPNDPGQPDILGTRVPESFTVRERWGLQSFLPAGAGANPLGLHFGYYVWSFCFSWHVIDIYIYMYVCIYSCCVFLLDCFCLCALGCFKCVVWCVCMLYFAALLCFSLQLDSTLCSILLLPCLTLLGEHLRSSWLAKSRC